MALRPALLTAVRMLIDEKDSANSHFTDPEIYTFINQAIRFMGTDLEWPLQTAQSTPVVDQAVYTLPEDFVSIVDVYYDVNPILIIDRADLKSLQLNWQDAPSALPLYAYKADNAKIGLWPPPSADHTANGETIQIQYIKVPPDLSDDSTLPDIHLSFHDCIPFYAAALCEHSMGNSKRGDQNFALYANFKRALQSKVQKFADGLFRFRWAGMY